MPMIDLEPIYLELDGDRRRQIAFTMRSEILLRERGYMGRVLVEKLDRDADGNDRYRINKAVLAEYLYAVLQRDAARNGELLERTDVEDLITSDKDVLVVLEKINQAIERYYGKPEPGEGNPPSQARRRGSKSHSR